MAVRRIPRSETASLTSSSSIVSPVSVVKELIDNSIDSFPNDDTKAQISIEVDISTGGLQYLSIKDNGSGINKNDIPLVCLNSTTSKISSLEDIKNGITTCGFRGEALFFISNLAGSLEFITRTKENVTCERWYVDNSGLPISLSESIAGPVGTTVKVRDIFKQNPPRRQYLKKQSRKSIESIKNLVYSYSLAYRFIRFNLKFVSLLPNNLVKVEGQGISLVSKLSPLKLLGNLLKLKNNSSLFESNGSFQVANTDDSDYMVKVDLVLPKMRAQDSELTKKGIKVITVNNRPLNILLSFGKLVTKILKSVYTENFLLSPLFWFISINIPIDKVDVNIEPEKSDILVSHEVEFSNSLQSFFTKVVKQNHNIEDGTNLADDSSSRTSHNSPWENRAPIQDLVDEILRSDNEEEDDELLKDLQFCIKTKVKKHPNGTENVPKDSSTISPNDIHLEKEYVEDIISDNSNNKPFIEDRKSENISTDGIINNHHSNESIFNNVKPVESSNDWSRSMVDGLDSSSNPPSSLINSSSQNVLSEVDEYQQPNDITISNPWTITKMAHEMKRSKIKAKNECMLPTPETTYESINPFKTVNSFSAETKCTPLGVTKSKKRSSTQQPILQFSKLPKLYEFSENTLNHEITIDSTTNNSLLEQHVISSEHEWLKRKGNPSESLTSGFLVLLKELESYNHLMNNDLIVSKNDENLFRIDV